MSKKRVAQVGVDCVACGNCAKSCPFGAISVYRGVRAKVDARMCRGCGKCDIACPAGVIGYEDGKAALV